MKDEMLLVELIEWCKGKIKESGTESGYYHKMIEVFEEVLNKIK